ncbi:hypothetical protein CFAM422_013248 [Trichoderma lentiforme]|uniref:Uncharacterized protein n=1 Tax=Trichoderma lentiforme TaxID=1567552 RepID=A0A9P4X120_9HYPO|nr:hypothetical protein CFAM422_013248 [Trichoderma lentiforme]
MPLLSIRECPPSFVGVEHAIKPLIAQARIQRGHIPTLVQSLGHAKFVRQGGDTGDFMDRHMSIKYPNSDVVGLPAKDG